MGVQTNLRGQGDYARTVESVSKQPADRDGEPDYQAIRNYVFSGAERGVLRVKYGNHNRDLELGTKGLFAAGERHDLTTTILRQVVERQQSGSHLLGQTAVVTTLGVFNGCPMVYRTGPGACVRQRPVLGCSH